MSTLAERVVYEPTAKKVAFTNDFLCLYLADGREIRVPIEFYPRLKKATKKQREKYEIVGNGTGIYWSDIDEDLSVEGIVEGYPSRF
ncbi:MAG: DUF2442 domain-containing protein [Candidatus Firestonebacteria bacterium]